MTDQLLPTHPFVVVHGEASPNHALDGAVLAIGNFDGVHRGHRAVIAAARARAEALGRPAAALTFEPHPRGFFRPNEPLFRLTDERAKLRLLAATGLDGAIVLRFDAALAGLSAADFVARILVGRFAVAGVTIGFDFHFGLNRVGSPEYLAAQGAKLGFAVDIVPRFEDQGRPVRSGPIRAALAAGHIGEANELLGYPWFVSAEVVHGDKRGRELGYPTANLRLDPGCGLKHGIYAVRVAAGARR
ncbi:MAG: bifunctional riboflavin kinase/FMN adenylyltransferase, partial [Xanthobacteraceae bacterium]